MKRFRLLTVLIACVFLWSGCGTEIAAPSAPAALPTDDGATEITIEVVDVGSFYQVAALKFEELTGVKVNVINHYNIAQSPYDQDYAYLDRIPGELMVGRGADIYADITLDFVTLGQQGYLCDLGDWIAADPYFSDEMYYMNILESGFSEGNVYSMPLSMMFMAFGSDVEIPELEGKSLNWEDFFELTRGVNRNGILLGMSDYEIFLRRFLDRYDSFIDEENNTANIDTPEMISLLEQCKAWSEQGLCIPNNEDNNTDVYDNAFIKEYGGGINLLVNARWKDSFSGESDPYWYDIPSDSGRNDKANKLLTVNNICINAASPYKGTVWKFIKFLLREDIQATSEFMPVNREAAEEHISKNLPHCIGYIIGGSEAEQEIEATEAILNGINTAPIRALQRDIIKSVIGKEAKRFFNDEISAEDTAKNMEAAVELYLKEQ